MQFHEIDMDGIFWLERLASLPSWTSTDEGRIVYSIEDQNIFYGNAIEWVSLPINVFKYISAQSGVAIEATSTNNTLTVTGENGIVVSTVPYNKELYITGSNSFGEVSTDFGSVLAKNSSDDINFLGDNGLRVTAVDSTKSVTFTGSNAYSGVVAGGVLMSSTTPYDALELIAGDGIILASEWHTVYDDTLDLDVGVASVTISTTMFDTVNDFFTSGRKLWLYENSAPTGWTILTACSDGLLAVKGGTQAYNVAGGTSAGTWTITGHTHTTSDFTLTETNLPAHYHFTATNESMTNKTAMVALSSTNSIPFYSSYLAPLLPENGYMFYGGSAGVTPTIGKTSPSGGSGGVALPHNHGATSSSNETSLWRPKAYVGIIVQKS